MVKLDKEEKEILESFEKEEWKPVKNKEKELSRYQKIANYTFKKDRRVNIRMSSKDLDALRKKALEEGIPYQTLISSILHKFITERLVDRKT